MKTSLLRGMAVLPLVAVPGLAGRDPGPAEPPGRFAVCGNRRPPAADPNRCSL